MKIETVMILNANFMLIFSIIASEESNWKTIRNEVFRSPDQKNLLCAAVGSGLQLILMVLLIFLLGAMGMYESGRGSLVTTGVVLYSFTACKDDSFTSLLNNLNC